MASPYACWAPRCPHPIITTLFTSHSPLRALVAGAMVVVVGTFLPRRRREPLAATQTERTSAVGAGIRGRHTRDATAHQLRAR